MLEHIIILMIWIFQKKKFNIKIDFDVLDIEEKDENNVDNEEEVK